MTYVSAHTEIPVYYSAEKKKARKKRAVQKITAVKEKS